MADENTVKKEHIEAVVNEVKKDEHVKKDTAASVIEEVKEQDKKEESKVEEKNVEEKKEEAKNEENKKEDVKEPKKDEKRMKAVVYTSYGGGASALKVITTYIFHYFVTIKESCFQDLRIPFNPMIKLSIL